MISEHWERKKRVWHRSLVPLSQEIFRLYSENNRFLIPLRIYGWLSRSVKTGVTASRAPLDLPHLLRIGSGSAGVPVVLASEFGRCSKVECMEWGEISTCCRLVVLFCKFALLWLPPNVVTTADKAHPVICTFLFWST